MNGTAKYPIICGRRNCAACGRWRPVTDFYWRWHKDGMLKGIETICDECRNRMSRERYEQLPIDKRRARIRSTTKSRRLRDQTARQKAEEQSIKIASMEKALGLPKDHVDFLPFRMWLLFHLRKFPSVQNMANQAHVSNYRLHDWINGYIWNDTNSEPTPIRSVRLVDVENVTTRLGYPEAVYGIYPSAYDW